MVKGSKKQGSDSGNAKLIGISQSFLSDILKGKKGCDEITMNKIKALYPDVDFYNFVKPRYKIKREGLENEL